MTALACLAFLVHFGDGRRGGGGGGGGVLLHGYVGHHLPRGAWALSESFSMYFVFVFLISFICLIFSLGSIRKTARFLFLFFYDESVLCGRVNDGFAQELLLYVA